MSTAGRRWSLAALCGRLRRPRLALPGAQTSAARPSPCMRPAAMRRSGQRLPTWRQAFWSWLGSRSGEARAPLHQERRGATAGSTLTMVRAQAHPAPHWCVLPSWKQSQLLSCRCCLVQDQPCSLLTQGSTTVCCGTTRLCATSSHIKMARTWVNRWDVASQQCRRLLVEWLQGTAMELPIPIPACLLHCRRRGANAGCCTGERLCWVEAGRINQHTSKTHPQS